MSSCVLCSSQTCTASRTSAGESGSTAAITPSFDSYTALSHWPAAGAARGKMHSLWAKMERFSPRLGVFLSCCVLAEAAGNATVGYEGRGSGGVPCSSRGAKYALPECSQALLLPSSFPYPPSTPSSRVLRASRAAAAPLQKVSGTPPNTEFLPTAAVLWCSGN